MTATGISRPEAHSYALQSARALWNSVLREDLTRDMAKAYYQLAQMQAKEDMFARARIMLWAVMAYLETLQLRERYGTKRPTAAEVFETTKRTKNWRQFTALVFQDAERRKTEGQGLIEATPKELETLRRMSHKFVSHIVSNAFVSS